MSNYAILQSTSIELRRRIHAALVSAPDADLGMTNPESDITLSPPSEDLADTVRLSLYLYHLEPDPFLRNQPQLPVQSTGLRFPPITLQLHYLITPLDDDEGQKHLILGRILQFFHDQPMIDGLNGSPLDDSFGGASPEMRVTLETLTLEELSRIWHALNASYQLSIAYKVRIVAIDSAQAEVEARRAMEVLTAVGLKQ